MTRIMVDCQQLLYNILPSQSSRLIMASHQYLLKNETGIEWLFIMDKSYLQNEWLKGIPKKNILLKKTFPNLVGWRFWLDYQLPILLRKYDADLLINTGGIAAASPVAQYSWMPAYAAYSGQKKNNSYIRFFEKRLAKTMDRSQMIVTFSEKKKQMLIQGYGGDISRMVVARSYPDERYRLLPWTEKENTKVKYAAGKEYFIVLVDSAQHDLIHILRAFSQFKKRQQSNIQLVLAGSALKSEPGFLEQLSTFKYRSDVHVYSDLAEDDFIKLLSAAYALVYPFDDEETGTIVLNAFKAHVPVIISDRGSLHEVAADAALYASIDDIELLASQLMLLYKDESLRNELIEKGKLQWPLFDQIDAMNKLKNAMMQAARNQS